MHLMMDGYGSEPGPMQDERLIYDLLDRYPEQIGMNKVAPPCVFRYVGAKPEDWGFSGFVLIAESHITIHTFVERRYVSIDVFSCREFDAPRVVREMKEAFKLSQVHTRILRRGLEYLQPPQPPLVRAESLSEG